MGLGSSISVLFATHAGGEAGLGHLSRSVVASNALIKDLNAVLDLVIFGEKVNKDFLRNISANISFSKEIITNYLSEKISKKHYDIVCLDLYHKKVDSSFSLFLELAKQKGCKIIAIDLFKGYENYLDLLFFPSFLKPQVPSVNIAYGWDCFLLNVQKAEQKLSNSQRILVLTGASDVKYLGGYWPREISRQFSSELDIDWIKGPFSKKPSFPKNSLLNFIEHQSTYGLTKLMKKANVALAIYGVSFYELLALGVPTVVYSPYNSKDDKELNAIRNLDVALVAKNKAESVLLLKELFYDNELRNKLSVNAKKLLNNHNGNRFSFEIKKILNL